MGQAVYTRCFANTWKTLQSSGEEERAVSTCEGVELANGHRVLTEIRRCGQLPSCSITFSLSIVALLPTTSSNL